MFYLVTNNDDPICVIEGDDVEEAEARLLSNDDRLDDNDVANFDFTPITVYALEEVFDA